MITITIFREHDEFSNAIDSEHGGDLEPILKQKSQRRLASFVKSNKPVGK